MWWNSDQNRTLDDDEYSRAALAIRRQETEAQQRQEQYERLLAESYYDQDEPGALDIRRN